MQNWTFNHLGINKIKAASKITCGNPCHRILLIRTKYVANFVFYALDYPKKLSILWTKIFKLIHKLSLLRLFRKL